MKKINLSEPFVDNNEFKSVQQVLKSGWLTSGKKTIELEDTLKKFFKVKNIIAVNSCTSGLHAALVASEISSGDEVITSPMTFVSTINNLYHIKAKIVLADISLEDFNIDVLDIKNKKTKKTKCILPVHYGGNPSDIEAIKEICKDKKIKIIEDAACAFGAKVKNKHIGGLDTDAAVFSLYGNKVITSGEGGIIAVNNETLARKIRELVYCGMSKSIFERRNDKKSWFYQVKQPGFKYNISDIQSAIVLAQIKKLRDIIKHRNEIFDYYNLKFNQIISDNLVKPLKINKNNKSSHYIYPLLIKSENLNCTRDDISIFLNSIGVGNTVHYIPAHKHNFYKKMFRKFNLKNCNYVYDRIISLPMHNNLKTFDINYVCKNLINFIKKNKKKKLF